jgi:hypothetical protein
MPETRLQLTEEQKANLNKARQMIAQELPDMIRRNQLAKDASRQPSFSGRLRRTIRTSKLLLPDIAARADIEMDELDKFLTGEQTLSTDQIDRLTEVLGLSLTHACDVESAAN